MCKQNKSQIRLFEISSLISVYFILFFMFLQQIIFRSSSGLFHFRNSVLKRNIPDEVNFVCYINWEIKPHFVACEKRCRPECTSALPGAKVTGPI